ncbi:MAG: hydroxyacid dehydrogenase [Acetobacteraceae bacterium]|nr:hydroxyacid dehydrogenase [Acetobacteraceae bacterium]
MTVQDEEPSVPDMHAPARRFRVGYLSHVPHQSFLDTAAKHPEMEVVRIPLEQPEEAVIRALAGCDAYYVMASRDELPKPFHVRQELLARLPNLLMVGSTGAGYDTVDPAACTAAGVLLVNQAGGNAEGVAEHAVGMMLALLKRMPEAQAAMLAGKARDRNALMGRELRGRTVGLVGIGHIGTRVSEIVRLAFSCRVLACDPYLDAATIAARGAEKVEMPQLLAESDIVTLHLPLTPESRNLMDAAAFARMKKGAIFITTARGNIHDEAALHAALVSGHLAGAGLDVWEQEPPPPDHPLLQLPNVIASQHTAGVTHESRANITRIAALAFADVANGRLPPRIINPQVVPRFAERWAAAFGRQMAV